MSGRRLLILLLLSLVTVACVEPNEVFWKDYVAPGGRRVLKVTYLEPPGFGPHSVRFYADNELLVQKSLHNDGKNLHDGNIKVDWKKGGEARITLHGEEQKDEVFTLLVPKAGAGG